jgi:mannosyltransferase OCH1-like enzyme
MKIPQIVHFVTYLGEEFVSEKESLKTWKEAMKGYQQIIWSQDMIYNFLKIHYRQYMDLYDSYDTWYDKKNVARLAILDAFGGIYIDIETIKCSQPIHPVIKDDSTLVLLNFFDPKFKFNPACLVESGFKYTNGVYIFDSFMASIPRHPFWRMCLNNMRTYQKPSGLLPKEVAAMRKTGPLFLTIIFRKHEFKAQIIENSEWKAYIEHKRSVTGYRDAAIILALVFLVLGGAGTGYFFLKKMDKQFKLKYQTPTVL